MARVQQMQVEVEFPQNPGRRYVYLVPSDFPELKRGDYVVAKTLGPDSRITLVRLTSNEIPANDRATTFLYAYLGGTDQWEHSTQRMEILRAEKVYKEAKAALQALLPNANL